MINPFLEINWKPDNKDLKSFGKTMIIGFTVISIIFFVVNLFRGIDPRLALIAPRWIFRVGVAIYITTLIVPKLILPIYYFWFIISASIGIVVANLLLMLFYYIIFSVFAVIFRLISSRDPLTLKRSNKDSYWVDFNSKKDIKRYFRQY